MKWQSTADSCRKKLQYGTSRELSVENIPDNRIKVWIRRDSEIADIRSNPNPDPDLVPSVVNAGTRLDVIFGFHVLRWLVG